MENLKRSDYKEFTVISRAADGSMTESKQKFCATMQSKGRDRLKAQTKAALQAGGSQSLLFSAPPAAATGNALSDRFSQHFC